LEYKSQAEQNRGMDTPLVQFIVQWNQYSIGTLSGDFFRIIIKGLKKETECQLIE
jgi:hypothetical protein